MANSPMGLNFIEGVLGVCNIEFNGVDLGITTDQTEITLDQDMKEIMAQQSGTKAYDHVRTGIVFNVTCTFGTITTALCAALNPSFEPSGSGQSMKVGRNLYQSAKDNEGKKLVLKRVDSEGVSTTDPVYMMTFYNAAPTITSGFVYGADVQRAISVTFNVYWDVTNQAYAYMGNASSVGLIPAV